jgi:putative nucleotidyltransferase with HDIG domain
MKKLLELLGIRQKKARPVGQSLEKGKEEEASQTIRKQLFIKGTIIALLLALVIIAFPRENTYQISVQAGDIWRGENLVAPFEFPIYKSDDRLQQERRAVRQDVRPVFQLVSDAEARSMERLDSLSTHFDRIFNAFANWQINRSRGRMEQAAQDSARYEKLLRSAPLDLSTRRWDLLLNSYVSHVPGISTPSRLSQPDAVLSERSISQVRQILQDLYESHVLDVPIDTVHTSQIVLRNNEVRTERMLPARSVYGIYEASEYAREQLNDEYTSNSDTVEIGMQLFDRGLIPSLRYRAEETNRRISQRQENISEVYGHVQEGQMIIRRGDVVRDSIHRVLTSLERFRAERTGNIRQWKMFLGQFILAGSIFAIFFLYLYLLHGNIYYRNKHVLLIAMLFGLIVGLFGIAVRLTAVPALAVPVAIASVLLTVVYNSRLGIMGTAVLALLGGAMAGYSYEFALVTLFAGVLAVFSVRDVRNRGQIVVSAGLVLAAYMLILGAFSMLQFNGWERFQADMWPVLINAGLLLFAYPLQWVVERTFDITTDLTLLELSDTNRPLLKKLSMRAPGSFHHSLQVANLAEAAADAVGANGLLARVGGLYHDIGKMLKPEYFIENQRLGENPHDKLSPHMSALILASHVKDGVELGRQAGLPQAVLDFIPTHHGTALMEYFYRRGLEQETADSSPVSEAEFRYPGPIPHSKETGILMLADSVEAACRSLEKPTPRKLETLVNSIFKTRIEDGQLDHCPLTFADLETIKETFANILSSMHHIRVKYPGQEEESSDTKAPETAAFGTAGTADAAPLENPPAHSDDEDQMPTPEETRGNGTGSADDESSNEVDAEDEGSSDKKE